MEIRFLGGAGEVTGSCYEVTVSQKRILLDCGMFQGHRREAFEKNRAFRARGRDVDAIVLSHAHIDHSGNLPQLAHSGFHGQIFCTAATRDLARVLLLDAARIQERDAEHLAKDEGRRVEPLFTVQDATNISRAFRAVPYDTWFDVVPGVSAKLGEAGHIIGSATVHLEVREPRGEKLRVTFTGDLGRRGVPLLRDPAPLPRAEVVITESTYGGRDHPDHDDPVGGMKRSLEKAVKLAFSRGGKLIIPAFSVGRTQNVLYFLNELVEEERIRPTRIFIDSPLSSEATAVVRRYYDLVDEEARKKIGRAVDPLLNPNVTLLETVEESKKLNEVSESCVIIAPSGMCEFGRILHHLARGLSDARNVIAFVGYQAHHTLGRRISDGLSPVRIFGRLADVRATVVKMSGFSAHADRSELLEALEPLGHDAERVFVVHGEPEQSNALARDLTGRGFRGVSVPAREDVVSIG
jgi:metallo-beta-lactamase family protein